MEDWSSMRFDAYRRGGVEVNVAFFLTTHAPRFSTSTICGWRMRLTFNWVLTKLNADSEKAAERLSGCHTSQAVTKRHFSRGAIFKGQHGCEMMKCQTKRST